MPGPQDNSADAARTLAAMKDASAAVQQTLTALARSCDRLREARHRLDDPARRQVVQRRVKAELNADPGALARLREALSGRDARSTPGEAE